MTELLDLEIDLDMESVSFTFDGKSYEGMPDFSEEALRELNELSAGGQLQKYGDLLFRRTFRGQTLEGFEQIRAALKTDLNKMFSLRLTISQSAPALHGLWWECLRDVGSPPHNRVIARSTYMTFSRCLPVHTNGSEPLNIDGGLRVLTVISNPNDLGQGNGSWARFAPLDYKQERDLFRNALEQEKIRDSIDFELFDESSMAGYKEIKERLRDDFNVLHLVGHAGYENDKKDLFFLLQDENGDAYPVNSSGLIEMLGGFRELRLVFLHPAHTITVTQNQADAWVQLAVDILNTIGDLPAVIAMKNPLDIHTGQKFIERFYNRLFYSKNNPGKVDAAINDARADVAWDETKRDWASPVLYLRGSSHLFYFDPAIKGRRYRTESSRGSGSYTGGQPITTQLPGQLNLPPQLGQLNPSQQLTKSADRKILLKVLLKNFNKKELRVLCFNLAIDVEEFEVDQRSVFAMGIIEYCERLGFYEDLINEINEVLLNRRLRREQMRQTRDSFKDTSSKLAGIDPRNRAMSDQEKRGSQRSDRQRKTKWPEVG